MNEGNLEDVSRVWEAVLKVELPLKKYFKIGEVSQLVGVESHVLRYWQTQFPQVRPQKSRSGHRQYRRKDVETLLAVKELLHVQRFTIAGAKNALRVAGRSRSKVPSAALPGDPQKNSKIGPETTTLRPPNPKPALAERTDAEAELEVVALENSALEAALENELRLQQGPVVELGLASKPIAEEASLLGAGALLADLKRKESRSADKKEGLSAAKRACLETALLEGEAILECLKRAAVKDVRNFGGSRRF